MNSPHVLVFQHIAAEHPGSLRDCMLEDGVHWTAVELDEGEPIPPLDAFDALLVMGGPMDVWQEHEHPWLAAEKAAIRRWVTELRRPYLGLCLGHQLLADALGGSVGLAAEPEIGIMPVDLTEAGRAHPVLMDIDDPSMTLQWHGAEVKTLPHGATVLATSPACAVNAMAVGECAFGFQYHVELTEVTIDEWAAIPEYAHALAHSAGPDALDTMRAKAKRHMPGFLAASRTLYRNFMRLGFGGDP
ncbi:MAG: type 1 glutamine amidotransferase [Pseudomonadota bacterium]